MSDEPSGKVKNVSEAISDLAKAEQERQKTTQELIRAARAAGAYFGPHFDGAISEFGKMIGDIIGHWRFLNLNRILNKVEKRVKEGSVHPAALRQLGLIESLRLIEAASAEEEETVQELWARLIANALKSDGTTVIKKVYVDLLKSISPAEAMLLDLLSFPFPEHLTTRDARPVYKRFEDAAAAGWRQLSIEDRKIATQNLVRLRCVTFKPPALELRDLLIPLQHDTRRCTIDAHKFESLLRHIGELIEVASGLSEPTRGLYIQKSHSRDVADLPYLPAIPERNLLLTPLGRGLMYACREDGQDKRA